MRRVKGFALVSEYATYEGGMYPVWPKSMTTSLLEVVGKRKLEGSMSAGHSTSPSAVSLRKSTLRPWGATNFMRGWFQLVSEGEKANGDGEAYGVYLRLEVRNCRILRRRKPLIEKIMPNEPSADRTRLGISRRTDTHELLDRRSNSLHILLILLRIRLGVRNGSTIDVPHDDVAESLARKGEVHRGDAHDAARGGVHDLRDVHLREGLAPLHLAAVFDPVFRDA